MRQIQRLVAAAGILAVVTAGHADTILRQRVFDLSRVSDSTVFTLYKTQVLGIGTDNEGLTAAQLSFPVNKASIGRSSTTSYEDWSPYNQVTFKLKNYESVPLEFRLLVYLKQSATDSTNMFSGRVTIGANETRQFVCHLNPDSSEPYGMEYLRPVLSKQFTNVYGGSTFRDLRTIYHWRISYQGIDPARVDLSDLRLLRQNVTFENMVDRFGQYDDRNWSTKIHEESDLQERMTEELSDLDANPPKGEMDGTSQIVNERPEPGRWKVATQSNGMKYLQHPSGKLFWALGLSAIHNGVSTPVEGRENYFQYLPSTDGRFASGYSIKQTLDGPLLCYSFHEQNLKLKYGDSYRTPWVSHVKKRLASWGLNTVGMQCLPEFYDNSMPYTVILYTRNFPTRLRVPKMLWGSFPDPFDPTFRSWAVTEFSKGLTAHNGRTNFMGVYVDNEMSWGSTFSDHSRANLALGVFKAPSDQPAKVATIDWLKRKYGTIGALNTKWGTSFASFDELLYGSFAPSTIPYEMGMDFRRIARLFAGKYFGEIRGALTDAGLSGLYLGCRYADWIPEVVESAEPYVDVHTFNVYKTVPYVNWNFIAKMKKPTMFSELGYSVQGKGTFGGPGEVPSQADRAGNLQAFLSKSVTHPNVVGAILYCYTDQMITGRWSDYENSGLGLVDVTDTPHYEAVNVLRDFSQNMYATRG